MPFGSLWLPVLASTVAVFVVSSILHMVLTYHRRDYKAMPNEDVVRDALGKGSLPPGQYFIPYAVEPSQMKDPAIHAKFRQGPVALITVIPNGPVNMPKHLALWLAFSFFVSFTAAYVARHTLHPGSDGMLVMRITAAVAFCAYALSNVTDSIWRGQPWSTTARAVVDGFVYALVTGVVFRLLWPSA